jgi:hypothetical protein
MIIGVLALAVATTGTAAAATGTVVNLADGSDASHLAKVDAQGRVQTSAANTVGARPAAPATVFDLAASLYNYDTIASGYQWPLAPSTATVSVNHVTVSPWISDTQPRLVQIYSFTVPAGTTDCNFNVATADFRELFSYRLSADAVVDDLPTPLVLKPKSGRPWCLATLSQAPSGDAYYAYLDMTGWVVSGTAPAGTTGASSAKPMTRRQLRAGQPNNR